MPRAHRQRRAISRQSHNPLSASLLQLLQWGLYLRCYMCALPMLYVGKPSWPDKQIAMFVDSRKRVQARQPWRCRATQTVCPSQRSNPRCSLWVLAVRWRACVLVRAVARVQPLTCSTVELSLLLWLPRAHRQGQATPRQSHFARRTSLSLIHISEPTRPY